MKTCGRCKLEKDSDEYYSNTPWCKDCNREAARNRYHKRKAQDPDKVRAEGAASSRRYYAKIRTEDGPKNQDLKARSRQRTRRYRGRVAESDGLWELILEKDPCSYCGQSGKHVDHIVPWSHSEDGAWDNLTGACGVCNSSKGTRSLLFFLLDS